MKKVSIERQVLHEGNVRQRHEDGEQMEKYTGCEPDRPSNTGSFGELRPSRGTSGGADGREWSDRATPDNSVTPTCSCRQHRTEKKPINALALIQNTTYHTVVAQQQNMPPTSQHCAEMCAELISFGMLLQHITTATSLLDVKTPSPKRSREAPKDQTTVHAARK